MTYREGAGLWLTILLRWWAFQAWLRHCPECGRRGYTTVAPRWENDRIAHMLKAVTPDRCRCCGKHLSFENLPLEEQRRIQQIWHDQAALDDRKVW